MMQCMKIIIQLQELKSVLLQTLRDQAHLNQLEGTVQYTDHNGVLTINVCGQGNAIEQFIDFIHHHLTDLGKDDLQLEPFIKNKDYRGAFRIIQ